MNPPDPATETAPPSPPAISPAEGASGWASLASTARKILEEKDISQVLRTVCEEACHVLGADRSLILRIQMDGPPRSQVMSSHNVQQEFIDALQASRSKSFIEGIFEKNRPLVFSDAERESRAFNPETIRRMGIRAVCAIPLIVEKEPFGALVLYHLNHREYGPHDLGLAEGFGDLASIAIEKARRTQADRQRATRLNVVDEIARAVGSELEPEEVFRTIADEIRLAVPYDRIEIGAYTPAKDGLQYYYEDADLPMGPPGREIILRGLMAAEVYRTKQPYSIPDILDSPRKESRHAKAGYRSVLFVPIIKDEACIAHIGLARREVAAFRTEHEELLTSLAGHLGSAIRNASLYSEAEGRATRLKVVGEIARAVGSELEPAELIKTIVHEIRKAVPCQRCVIGSKEGLEGPFIRRWHGESEKEMSDFREVEEFYNWLDREVYKPGRMINIPDLRELDTEWFSQRVKEGHLSIILVPVLQDGVCVAHIGLSNDKVASFSSAHEELLTAIAEHLAPAIRNASLYRESEERASRLEIAGNIARAVGSTLKPDELFKTIAREIRQVIPCERFVIGSLDRERSRNRYWHVESEIEIPDYGILEKKDNFWYGDVIDLQRPVNFPDIREIDTPRMKEMAEAGFRSYLIVPILQDDRYIAHISLVSTETDCFTADQIELLTSITGYLSPAIRNAGLYQAAEERASRLTALNDLNQKISENLDLNEVLDKIVRAVVELIHGEHSRIFLLEGTSEMLVLRATHGRIPGPPEEGLAFRMGEGIIGKLAQSGEAVILPDVQEEPGWVTSKWVRAAGIHSYIATPLRQSGKVIGVISCFSRKRNFFSEEDLDFLNALAAQAVVAIENARLHGEAERSRKFLESVVTDSADPIIIVDPDRNIILWNSGAESLYGYAKEEVLGRHVNMIVPEKDREETYRINREMLEEGIPVTVETERVSKDGRVIPVSMTLSPVRREDGTLIANAGIHKDLTERHRAEEALRQSEEKFRSLVEFAADTIFVHDSSGKLLDVNQRACESLGYTREELLALGLKDIETTFESGRHMEKWKAMKLDEPLTLEGVNRRKDGTEFPVEVRLGKFFLDGRELFVGLVRDMTQHKEAEDRVLRAMGEAEAASRAKSEFLSNMSHELRSPLNSVVGFSDLLIRDSDDEMTLKLAPKIKESGEYLAKLIEDLLDFDRIESGNVKLEEEEVSINDLVKNVVEARAPQLTEGHSLEIHLNPSCGTLSCDPTRISQVLINLLDNAVKYSPGGGAIHIRTDARPDEIWVSVKDNGLGMSPEELEVIFERFRQLESGFMRRSGGLGIGLSLIRELVGLHGGRIWVESEKGKGSIFTFALPRALPGGPDMGGTEADSRDAGAVAAASPWDKISVLIMDDLEHYHIYMRLLMSGAERVLSAYDGVEGVETAAREQPDLILVDLRMPVMDGFEAIENLRGNPLTREIPTLAVTAQVMKEDRGRSLKAGADGFVTKPIDIDALKKEVARILDKRG